MAPRKLQQSGESFLEKGQPPGSEMGKYVIEKELHFAFASCPFHRQHDRHSATRKSRFENYTLDLLEGLLKF